MAKNTKNGRKRSGNAKADSNGNGSTEVEEKSPFKYFVNGERARVDGAFFELLISKVLQERGKLADFDEVWPRGAQALAGLNTLRLSQHSPGDLENIIGTVGGEFAARLHKRTGDLIHWADAFWRIRQIYGSFRQYVRSFDADGHEVLVDDLSERLTGLSANLIVSFLRDAGEKVPSPPKIDRPLASGGRSGKAHAQGPKKGRGNNQGSGGRRRQPRGGSKTKNGGGKSPDAQQKTQQQPAEANQEKSGSKSRRGRRGFFRRKRAARGKTTKTE